MEQGNLSRRYHYRYQNSRKFHAPNIAHQFALLEVTELAIKLYGAVVVLRNGKTLLRAAATVHAELEAEQVR